MHDGGSSIRVPVPQGWIQNAATRALCIVRAGAVANRAGRVKAVLGRTTLIAHIAILALDLPWYTVPYMYSGRRTPKLLQAAKLGFVVGCISKQGPF